MPVECREFSGCGMNSLVRQPRLPGGGSRGEAETAHAEYGIRALERPTL